MKVFFCLVLSLAGCSSVPTVVREPVLEGVESSYGYRTEIWKRSDGSRFIRFKLSTGEVKEVDIFSENS